MEWKSVRHWERGAVILFRHDFQTLSSHSVVHTKSWALFFAQLTGRRLKRAFQKVPEIVGDRPPPTSNMREVLGGWVYFLAEVLCWPFCLLFEITLNILDITRPSSLSDTIRPECWNWKLKPAVKLQLPAAPPARLQGVQTWWHGANDSIIWYYYRCRCPYLTSESDAVSFLPVFRLTEGVTPCVSDVLIWNVLRWLMDISAAVETFISKGIFSLFCCFLLLI